LELGKQLWAWSSVQRKNQNGGQGLAFATSLYLLLCGRLGEKKMLEEAWDEAGVAGVQSHSHVVGAMFSALSVFCDAKATQDLLATIPLSAIDEHKLSSALTAYSHASQPKEALALLGKVEEYHGSNPGIVGIQAYTAVVDAFSRVGEFDTAISLVKKAKLCGLQPDASMWTTILSPCRHYANLEVASKAFQELQKLAQISLHKGRHECSLCSSCRCLQGMW